MKFYIATRLENHALHNDVRDALVARGHKITYDWTIHGPVWRDGVARIQEVCAAELQGVYAADVVVVLLPGGRGTHAELGAALARGKSLILWHPDHVMFEASPETCAFYHDKHAIRVSGPAVTAVVEALYTIERCLRLANDDSGERCSVERRHHGPETWIGQRHDFDGPSERLKGCGA